MSALHRSCDGACRDHNCCCRSGGVHCELEHEEERARAKEPYRGRHARDAQFERLGRKGCLEVGAQSVVPEQEDHDSDAARDREREREHQVEPPLPLCAGAGSSHRRASLLSAIYLFRDGSFARNGQQSIEQLSELFAILDHDAVHDFRIDSIVEMNDSIAEPDDGPKADG